MGKRPPGFGVILVLMLAACGAAGRDAVLDSGPQLVSDVTIAPATVLPTRILSPTPSPVIIPVSTAEAGVPLPIVTLKSNLKLVTPTLPPSKTPTLTPTNSLTPLPTRPATNTPPPSPTPFFSAAGTLPPAVVGSSPGCGVSWFFAQPTLTVCPLNPPLASQGSYQPFQNGMMIWVQQQDAIYVLYNSLTTPRWQVFNDAFQEGMPETDAAFDNAPPNTWQPRRGFGLLWRMRSDVRDRLGWAVAESEMVYSLQVQIAADGTLFLNEASGGILSLAPDGSIWNRY